MIQHLPRFRHQQHPFVFAVRESAGLNRRRIPIAEVDLGTNLLWNPGRQGNLDSAVLDSVLVGSDAADVRGMGQLPPRGRL